jgi:hypothetical protein
LARAGALGELTPDLAPMVKDAEEESTRLIDLITEMLEVERSKTRA